MSRPGANPCPLPPFPKASRNLRVPLGRRVHCSVHPSSGRATVQSQVRRQHVPSLPGD